MFFSWWHYPALFATGLVAGFVDSIAGGGGLITLPVLMNLGLPTADALGTNKLQAGFGSGSAAWSFARSGMIDLRACRRGVALTFAGAAAGSWLLVLAERRTPDLLRQAIPWLLAGIAIYMLLQPRLGEGDARPRWEPALFFSVMGLGLGFYDGFFGPGTGTFWAMAFMLLLGFNMARATAHTKLMNFTSNMASLAVFASLGHVNLAAGLTMGAGQWIGARVGSRTVIRRGTKLIRPVFITVVLVITARLVWQNIAGRR